MHILKLHNKLMYTKDICNLYTDLEISEKKYAVLICLCVFSIETAVIANPIQSNVAGREKCFLHTISLSKNKRLKYNKKPTDH